MQMEREHFSVSFSFFFLTEDRHERTHHGMRQIQRTNATELFSTKEFSHRRRRRAFAFSSLLYLINLTYCYHRC